MKLTGTAVVDHHQFVIGSPMSETYEPSETGSVIEVGANFVTIKTGIAYGPAALALEVLDREPAGLDTSAEWEVVEEATIEISKPIRVVTLDGRLSTDFDRVPITKGLHTFRVSAQGRDTNWDSPATEPTESYFVQIWKATQPASMRRLHKTDTAWDDEIVTHKVRNFWDPDPAGDATLYVKYGYEQMAIWAKEEAIRWGGRPPTDKLRKQSYAQEFATHDRMLVDAIARCRAPKLRLIAAWAARRAYSIANIAEIDWIRDGLEALKRGEQLPFPFDDRSGSHVRDAFDAEPRIQLWTTDDENGQRAATPAQAAIHALTDASNEEPLTAVFRSLRTAALTDGSDYLQLITDLRREFFPKLAPADQYERWIGHSL
ncbi:transposase [Rhodococcoides yunnanense]|uniref:transposase n=1 Tax=Rhodococcoides yunnanense TaxID=278209 RepID=UPI0022B0C62F|nr:transposase [Rhodococcus yunnanensis]MCZ4278755.1 transposase [Rhodococcus yunnanensis]